MSNKENTQELVNEKGDAFEIDKADHINFEPAPNTILAVPVTEKKKSSGLILPDSVGKESNPTPIGKIIALGENIPENLKDCDFTLEEGDFIYIDGRYMNFVQVDDVKCLLLMVDGILGKIPQNGMTETDD